MRPVRLASLLLAGPLLCAASSNPGEKIHIRVDASAKGYPINPLIYGVSFASTQVLKDLNLPLNRSGGNSASLYNWQIDARNAGADYFFESLPVKDEAQEQFGRKFVASSRAGGARAMLTMPLSGWVARLGPGRTPLAGFSIGKYGPQTSMDRWMPDAGNGLRADRRAVIGNDPNEAATPLSQTLQQAWVKALVAEWGKAADGGVAYWLMDNEPSLWHRTHRAVRPVGAHAQEMADKVIAASAMIKAIDPTARIVAPEEWGWGGYKHSGFDQQLLAHGGSGAKSDRVRQTGGMDYLPWLLQRWKKAGSPVDVVSVHFYPQGGEYETGSAAGPRAIQLLRNRSTRLLWDPHYREESWIGTPVALVPLLRGWVDRYYHMGTPIAVTEYNWGGEDSMSGAVAQADIWGIFGRERLDIANRWPAPKAGTPTYQAMQMMRNYDGRGSGFGDVSLPATVPDSDRVSAFAARRSKDGALTLLVINKHLSEAAAISINIAGQTPRAARLRAITLAGGAVETTTTRPENPNRISMTMPSQSVTLLMLEGAQP